MKAKLSQRPAAKVAVERRRSHDPRVRATRPPPAAQLQVIAGGLDASAIMRLQAMAGNEAVGHLLAERARPVAAPPLLSVQAQAVACPPAPPAPAPRAPDQDPRFQAVAGKVEAIASKQKAHPSPASKVKEAQEASVPPSNDTTSQAAAAHVDEMGAQKPGTFDKKAFIASVRKAIEDAMPKTTEDAKDFAKSDKASAVSGSVIGHVAAGKDQAAGAIKSTTEKPPDPSRAQPKEVVPMAPEPAGAPPGSVETAGAVPPRRPAEEVSLERPRCETDQQLGEANVTPEMVRNSNEPQFQEAMAAKSEAEVHSEQAPKEFRQQEGQALQRGQQEAAGSAAGGVSTMLQSRTGALGAVSSGKEQAKGKDEKARTDVANQIQQKFDATKIEVDGILGGLDKLVGDAFESGEKAARDQMKGFIEKETDAFTYRRYFGPTGSLVLWGVDRITSPPPELNRILERGKQIYIDEMVKLIDRVADIVGGELTRAKQRIEKGRAEIERFVSSQPRELQQVAKEAAGNIESKFAQLEQDVASKKDAVVSDLAQKYIAANQAVDEDFNKRREANKGLWDRAKDQVGGMVGTFMKMREMLASMAARAGDVVDKIIEHPVEFLGNLIAAVKKGFGQFVDNILTHLKKGLMSWLFGEVAKAGITLPGTFDLKGILMLLAQVLGLTWANIRGRAVQILGPKVMDLIDKGAAVVQKALEIFNLLKNEGIAGVIHLITDKISEIKDQVMESVRGMVIEEVIKAGVKWVLGLLNPASALVKACMAIYDIVMFFVNHGKEIVELVNAVIDNLAAIVAGNIGQAANMVEQALGKAVPIAISFLASLAGLGDLGSKIQAILEKIRQPVNMAVDWLLKNVVKPFIGFIGKGVAWVKAKAKAGVEKLKKKFGKKDKRSPAERKAALDAAMAAGQNALGEKRLNEKSLRARLASIKTTYRVKKLALTVDSRSESSETVHIEGANSPTMHGPAVIRPRALRQFVQCTDDSSDLTASGSTATLDLGAVVAQRKKVIDLIKDKLPLLVLGTFADLGFGPEIPYTMLPTGPKPPHTTKREQRLIKEVEWLMPIIRCHTCGTVLKRNTTQLGKIILDHQPPSELARQLPEDIKQEVGLPTTSQNLYPQCESDSGKQGKAVQQIMEEVRKLKAMAPAGT